MAKTPDTILKLVENFEQNIDSFKGQGYNEATLRQEFINPFFEALGWDIQNKAGIAAAYKDVIHEDAIKIGGTTKAPDYCFRIGATKKFFVEAKKPAVDIKTEISPAYQLRRYAWSAKLPLSILTDFEEFAVYDCQIRPNVNDKPSTARIFYCNYKEYGEKWEQIANIFGKEAVLKGLFDKYASEKTTKRGTTTVDKEFLAEIEEWRNDLAKNIAIRNSNLSVYDLNFAVQKTIDRILFLRICEDRGIERSEQLLGFINGSRIYPRLFELFEKSDERYNSGIFHFRREKDRPEEPDELSANLKVDDDVLKKIIKDLYYPCPYEFSIMPAEILGNVYEQFLGKVIRLTASHQAKIEEKPEVKKAGGVYYTPSYIVDYIVKNTVGKLCEGKTPKQIEKIKILDPACGSGSFLIGAYQYLLDYHRDFYEKEASKYKKVVYQGKGGQWFLTIDEKKRILLNNIYGVDIDSQAAEVTKLSLLLKVLENETQESLRLFHERALPDLGNNIKCGNSLIGPDFYQNQQLNLFDDEQQRKINAFDWEKEFSEILGGKNPGFDCVIGNPPWGADIDTALNYFHKKFPDAVKQTTDSFKLFISQGCKLSSSNGYVSMIVPQPILRQNRYTDIRALLLKFSIESLVDLGEKVFDKVVAPSVIFVVKKSSEKSGHLVNFIDLHYLEDNSTKEIILKNPLDKTTLMKTSSFAKVNDYSFIPNIYKGNKRCSSLGDFDEIQCKDAGINYQRVGVGMSVKGNSDLGTRLLYEGIKEKSFHVMFWKGSDIGRYWIVNKTQRYCRPEIKEKLRANEVIRLAIDIYRQVPKILLRQTADKILASIDYEGIWFGRSVLSILPKKDNSYKLEYLLGLLNSKYLNYLYQNIAGEKGRVFAQVKFAKLKQLPIRLIDFSKPDEVKQHDKMVSLVDEMLELHKKISKIKNPNEKTRIQRQIEATDDRIDKLVYELYGLTPEEVAIVKGKE
ncbi:MAG: N-6 DNA methylase [Sedimentisphaerales bacterium]